MNIETITKFVTIRVNHIPEDISDDFTLTIENDNNSTRIISVSPKDINKFSNTIDVVYEGLYEFTLSSLKVTCKYPVKIYCKEFTLGGCIVPDSYNTDSHNKITSCSVGNSFGQGLEFEGTEEQIKAFEATRKEMSESLYPRPMGCMDILSLALSYKLVLKKVINKEDKENN